MNIRKWLYTLIMTATLVACGGNEQQVSTSSPLLTAATGSTADLNQQVRMFKPMIAVTTTSATSITEDQLFDWAERTFPDFFPTHQTNQSLHPYIFRYYPESDLYVGVSDGAVYLLGTRHTQGKVVRVGAVEDFAPQVIASLGLVQSHYSVQVDLTQINYPGSYISTIATSAEVSSNPCELNAKTIAYPKAWIGRFQLPSIDGAPLKSAIGRGMYMKDIMLPDNPSFIAGCSGNLLTEFDKTILRLKTLGVEYAVIPQWHWASNRSDGSWYITRAEDTYGALSDAHLSYFVNAAHRSGLKVVIKNQIQGFHDYRNPNINFIPEQNTDNFKKFFAAYQTFIADRAQYFQSIGMDVWEIGCNSCMYHDQGRGTPEDIDLLASEYAKAAAQIKGTFTGKTLFWAYDWLQNKPDLLKNIDIIETSMWHRELTASEVSNFSVNTFKKAVQEGGWIDSIKYYEGLKKHIFLSFSAQSRDNLFSFPGHMEETGCTTGIGDLNISPNGCIQRETNPDFSIQAIIYEATLESINQITTTSPLTVLAGEYWEVDSLQSPSPFPNIGASPRNKPAEGVLKHWFTR
jgi:hypothetical protein